MSGIVIRPAQQTDRAALGRLGALLLRVHHGFDDARFMAPGDDPEGGYAWFLGVQMNDEDAVVLVATDQDTVVGYVYAGIEPQSWKELREACGFVHDLMVDPEARLRGIGAQLLEAAVQWLRARDMPRVVLWSAEQNIGAQRLFARAQFRRTMVEMTREL